MLIRSTSTQDRSLNFCKREDEEGGEILKVEIQLLKRSRNSVKTMRLFLGFTFPAHLGDPLHSYFEPFVERVRETSRDTELHFFLMRFILHNSLRCLVISSLNCPFFLDPTKGQWRNHSLGRDRARGRCVHGTASLGISSMNCKIIQAIKSSKIICSDCHFSV